MTYINFKALYEQNGNLHRLYEIMQRNLLREPEKPVKPILPNKHTSVEVQVYQLELQKYELLSVSYKEELKNVEEHNAYLEEQFEHFLKEWSGVSFLNPTQRLIVADFYYEYLDEHYAGVIEEYVRKKGIIDLILKFNQS